jgi:hypothetical protein
MLSLFAGVLVMPLGTLVSAAPSVAAEHVVGVADLRAATAAQEATKESTKDQATRDRTQDRGREHSNTSEEDATDRAVQHVPRHDIGLIDDIPDACWEDLRKKRVYFAHGPVGKELLVGLHAILDERPSMDLKVIAYGEAPSKPQAGNAVSPPPFGTPAIVEGPTGADGDPMSKIDRFVAKLRSKEGQNVDVAVLLLSAEDFTRETNVESLHQHYVETMRSLSGERPNLRIVHSTVPLAVPDHGVTARMKKFVGRGADQLNAQRGRFNDLLRAEFGREAIFDIAQAESERMDGKSCSVLVGSVRWPALTPEHADERGHLNDEGRIAIAREFATALVRPCVKAQLPKEAEVTVVPGTGGSD